MIRCTELKISERLPKDDGVRSCGAMQEIMRYSPDVVL